MQRVVQRTPRHAARHALAARAACGDEAGPLHAGSGVLRQGSATFRRWQAAELSEQNGVALYIPAGVAHGFQSLADASEVFYQIAEASAGVRWDDPAFGIDWPIRAPILSDRDAGYGDFSQDTHS